MHSQLLPSSTLCLLFAAALGAQQQPPPTNERTPLPEPVAAAPAWTFGLSAYTYSVPENRDYVQPTLTADRDWLHLEARYNYEDLDTGSIWCGANFAFGDELRFQLTPMVGAVFGQTQGIAPGYRASASWWQLELSSEGEYLVDTEDSAGNYLYTWSELTLSLTGQLRIGYSVQRTKVYQTDFDIQRGFVVGVNVENLDLTAYVFNADESRPVVVIGLGLNL
ncbi:MAG: hypothetical protein KF830_12330 [Planctomycetes bacterium]|nr:hypothetical protein [Planctomycetota bacterium]